MKVTIIGTGNVATVLAKRIAASNLHTIEQVYGRNLLLAEQLASRVNAAPVELLQQINGTADLYIIAVADKAIEWVSSQLKFEHKIVVHTAGSVSKDVLKDASKHYGVLYPIQSLRRTMDDETPIPFLVDGSDVDAKSALDLFAKTISSQVVLGNDDTRLKLHTAAVFACNFVNYMYLQSATFCEQNGLDFHLLQPLIEETAIRLRTQHPQNVFTGPAVRKDHATIHKHLEQLQQNPKAQELYKLLSGMIMQH